MQDETAKDNGQTAAGISLDLIWNNELALLQEIFNFPYLYMYLSEKAIFYHKPALVTSLHLFNNQTTELTWKWVQIVKIYNGTGSRHG